MRRHDLPILRMQDDLRLHDASSAFRSQYHRIQADGSSADRDLKSNHGVLSRLRFAAGSLDPDSLKMIQRNLPACRSRVRH